MKNQFLNLIREKTTLRLKNLNVNLIDLRKEAASMPTPHDFLEIFSYYKSIYLPACVIAEIKFASPSLGDISQHKDCVKIAEQYLKHGASALSVLTEPEFFKGSVDYLKKIHQAFPTANLLMKDFIQDEIQLLQAKVSGANAVLLIVAYLSQTQLNELYQMAILLGLTPLVEAHSQDEIDLAKSLGAKLIGVNNRNLQTLKIDLATSKTATITQSSETHFISESGIQNGVQVTELQQLGFKGFLIGSHFMASHHPGTALSQLLNEARNAS
ncbi:MAG: indole-3-glycerol phosphate synthase TrpC [Gammaproteobacteria bacterium]